MEQTPCFQGTAFLLDGIGSVTGFTEGLFDFESSTRLRCFCQRGVLIYEGALGWNYCDDVVAGITENSFGSALTIYPNPVVNGQLTIENAQSVTHVEFYNVLGECVLLEVPGTEPVEVKGVSGHVASTSSATSVTIDVSVFPNGIYILRLSDVKGNAIVRKVVIDN